MDGSPIDGFNGDTVSSLGEGEGGHRVWGEEVLDDGELRVADENGGSAGVSVLGGEVGLGDNGYLEGRHCGRVGGSSRNGLDRWVVICGREWW